MLGSRVEPLRGNRIDAIFNLYPKEAIENQDGRCLKCIKQSKTCIDVFLLIMIPSMLATTTYVGTACAVDVCRTSPDNYFGIGACSVLAAVGAGGFLYTAVRGVKFICEQRKQKIDRQNLMAATQGE